MSLVMTKAVRPNGNNHIGGGNNFRQVTILHGTLPI